MANAKKPLPDGKSMDVVSNLANVDATRLDRSTHAGKILQKEKNVL